MAHTEDSSNWIEIVGRYNKASAARSWWQVINSLGPYIGLWVLMYYSLEFSYWLTLGLSVLAAGFLVRIFIIFHDCGHGSFFKSAKANERLGIIMGALVYTPYHRWNYEHMVHHKTVGNLDKRGMGDVLTMTVEEYNNSTPKKRFWYRMYRNPVLLLIIVPFLLFTLVYRLPGGDKSRKMNLQTHLTTLGLIIAVVLMSWWIGWEAFLLIQVPTLLFASIAGVWLFYVQHQYKDVVWERSENWDYKKIAMEGSSFVKLPRVLQFFSGNIGYHHIHHLGPKIPNYYLEKCCRENPSFQKKPLSLRQALQSTKYRLWDEQKHRLVSYREAAFE